MKIGTASSMPTGTISKSKNGSHGGDPLDDAGAGVGLEDRDTTPVRPGEWCVNSNGGVHSAKSCKLRLSLPGR